MSTDAVTKVAYAQVAPYDGPHAIPGIRFRAVREALGVTAWGMNVIEIDPHTDRYPTHDHRSDRHEEVYVVLDGEAVLHVEDAEVALATGDMVRVDGSATRRITTGDRGVVVLALGGTPGQPYAPSMGG